MSSEEDGELLMANVPPFLHPFVSDSNILSHSEELKKQNIGNGLYKYTFSLELQIGIDNSGKIINHSKEQSSKDKEEVLDINCPCKKWNLKNSPRKSKKELSNVIESKNAEERSVPVICYGIKYNKESQLFVPSTHSFCFPRTYTLSKVLDVFFKDSKKEKITKGLYISEISKEADYIETSKLIKEKHLSLPLSAFIHNKYDFNSLIIMCSEG